MAHQDLPKYAVIGEYSGEVKDYVRSPKKDWTIGAASGLLLGEYCKWKNGTVTAYVYITYYIYILYMYWINVHDMYLLCYSLILPFFQIGWHLKPPA